MDRIDSGKTASIVFAAGKGSRMTGYEGNKTLLPLIPAVSLYEGERPLLAEVLDNLPPGPKGIVVHHFADDIKKATEDYAASYILQPQINGTGGALLAAKSFLEEVDTDFVIVTMGDVPLIRLSTYEALLQEIKENKLVVLAFEPSDKAQYGLLELAGNRVVNIVEWKYWRFYSPEEQGAMRLCNAGVYAADRFSLLEYMTTLAKKPHHVQKCWGEEQVTIKEFFLTDLVELMSRDGVPVGMLIADEEEVMGVDTPEALRTVQHKYLKMKR